ncbi:hypothetical protein [Streptosporangium roseum]|nr:hypothetical protein [Streptosporangium roseum]
MIDGKADISPISLLLMIFSAEAFPPAAGCDGLAVMEICADS